jgi:membrane fusion protein (multidrug efflux system)
MPWGQRLKRFAQGGLPAVTFVVCAAALAWMWNRQTSNTAMIGELFGRRTEIYTEVAGRLLPLPAGKTIAEFTPVEKGEILAMLDRGPTEARLRVLEAEMSALAAEVDATVADSEFNNARAASQYHADAARLYEHLSRLMVEKAQTAAQLAIAGVEHEHDVAQHAVFVEAFKRKAIAEKELNLAAKQMAVSGQAAKSHEATIARIDSEMEQVHERLKMIPGVPVAKVKQLLEPIHKQIATHERMIEEVNELARNLVITAPFSGVVTQVHLQPGQAVQTGAPVLTLATTDVPYVITYVRDTQYLRPKKGMKADIRFRTWPQTISGTVVDIGPQVEPVSIKQQHNPQYQEFGLPVAIALVWPPGVKEELHPRPGELVNVTLRPTDDIDEQRPPSTPKDVLSLWHGRTDARRK